MAAAKSAAFEGDLTDHPLSQLVIGGSVGYLAGHAAAVAAAEGDECCVAWTAAAGLLAYRVAHEMGFFEVNMRRHADGNDKTGYVWPVRNRGDCGQIGDFVAENSFIVTSFLAGYILATKNFSS